MIGRLAAGTRAQYRARGVWWVVGVVLAAAAAATGCGKGEKTVARPPDRPPPAALERDCTTHVEGRLPDDWQVQSVVAGPLAFAGARTFANYENPNPGARFAEEKILVVVKAGARPTVVVPLSWRRDAALDYGFGGRPRKRTPPVKVSDGLPSVRFSACRSGTKPRSPGHPLDRETQFNGGIITRWGRCLPLDVYVEGARPVRATISFGAGRCPARRT